MDPKSLKANADIIHTALRHTLLSRKLCRRDLEGTVHEVQWKRVVHLPDLPALAFEVDVHRLPVRLELLTDPKVAEQLSASLKGRRVEIVKEHGVFFVVGLEPPGAQLRFSVPKRVDLTTELIDMTAPSGGYAIPIGMSPSGAVWKSLIETGHILVGGESGSGKTTWLHAMLISLLRLHTPAQLRVAIVDPKEVDFMFYSDVPHIWKATSKYNIAYDVEPAAELLSTLMAELDTRRAQFRELRARSLDSYNARSDVALPRILVIIDEVTDIALAAGLKSKFYTNLIRLTSKGRSFGFTFVLATQNPKAEVLNTLIRGNLSTRVCFRVVSAAHSTTVLGQSGAQLLPQSIKGRMLVRTDDYTLMQGYFIDIEQYANQLSSTAPITNGITPLQKEMVLFAHNTLAGKFTIDKLAEQFQGRMCRQHIAELSQAWERRGYLVSGTSRQAGKTLSIELLSLIQEGA